MSVYRTLQSSPILGKYRIFGIAIAILEVSYFVLPLLFALFCIVDKFESEINNLYYRDIVIHIVNYCIQIVT